MTKSDSIRLAALFTHPIQYFAPLFRHLAFRPEIDLTVYYCSRQGVEDYVDPGFGQSFKWDIPLLEGYRSQFLPGIQTDVGPAGFWRPFNPGIIKELLRERYDAIWVHGHYSATNWLGMLAARSLGARVLLRSESNLESLPRSSVRRIAKRLALKGIFSLVDGFLYIGERNATYYRYYGVPEEQLFFAPYVVDNDFFQTECRRLKPQRASIRASFGICDERPVILFVGKLVPKKQPLMVLDAYAQVRERHSCALLFAGDGGLRGAIEERVSEGSIPDVYMTGFLNQTKVPEAYIAADILVLPSAWRETWGLVANEGMNFGLPVVVSDRVGCAGDLVKQGENGYVVSYDDTEALASAVQALVADSELQRSYGQRSSEIVSRWGLKECGDGIVNALRAVV